MKGINMGIEQRTDEWFDMRRGMVTASRMADLMGKTFGLKAKDYAIKNAVEKLGGIIEKDDFVSGDIDRGNTLEDEARKAYERNTLQLVKDGGFWVAETGGGVAVGASPDGLVGYDGLIEIKCPRWNNHYRPIVEKDYDTNYKWQIQFQLMVTGRKWCDFVSYCPVVPFQPLYIYRVFPDEEAFEQMNLKLEEFDGLVSEYMDLIGQ